MWTYSRIDRLDDLIGRSREAERYLTRERADQRVPDDRARIDRGLAIVIARIHRLQAEARRARRAARALVAVA